MKDEDLKLIAFLCPYTHTATKHNIHTQETGNLKEKSHQYIQNKQQTSKREKEPQIHKSEVGMMPLTLVNNLFYLFIYTSSFILKRYFLPYQFFYSLKFLKRKKKDRYKRTKKQKL